MTDYGKMSDREIDAAVGEWLKVMPRLEWWCMDREEEGIYISFDNLFAANQWHNDSFQRFPNGLYARDGGHVVEAKIYPRYSSDRNAAAEVVERVATSDYALGFVSYLQKVLVQEPLHELSNIKLYWAALGLLTATSRQICEAALKAQEGEK